MDRLTVEQYDWMVNHQVIPEDTCAKYGEFAELRRGDVLQLPTCA